MVSPVHENQAAEEFPVVIVGAGPVGLSLALGLARLGVRSVVLEKNQSTSVQSKAPGIHIRTREIFREWGVEERMLAEGVLRESFELYDAGRESGSFLEIAFDELRDEAERPGLFFLEQGRTEALLLEAVLESGFCDVRFGCEVIGMETEPGPVGHGDGAGSNGAHRHAGENQWGEVVYRQNGKEHRVRGRFLVGCDGARSFVRRALGLPFDGQTYSIRPVLADVRIEDARDELPWPRLYNGADGMTAGLQLRPNHWRIIRLESGDPNRGDEVGDDEIQARVNELFGTGAVERIWASRFRIHLRHAPTFRVDNVILAGDAAHIHSPAGGLGMNTGIQDAHNLAWKLVYSLHGGDTERLLESYDIERREVAVENVSGYADLITRIFLLSPRIVRSLAFLFMRLMIKLPRARRRALTRATMIAWGYPASPLLDENAFSGKAEAVGRRLPNVRLWDATGQEVRLCDTVKGAPMLIVVGRAKHPQAVALCRKLGIPTLTIGAEGGFVPQDPTTVETGGIDMSLDGAAVGGDGSIAGGILKMKQADLSLLLKSGNGLIFVRPDKHIAWAIDADGGNGHLQLDAGAFLHPLGWRVDAWPEAAGEVDERFVKVFNRPHPRAETGSPTA